MPKKLKDLKKGEYFTLKPIAEPTERLGIKPAERCFITNFF